MKKHALPVEIAAPGQPRGNSRRGAITLTVG